MVMTMQQIWETYSELDFVRVIEIDRMKTDGTWEGTWSNVEDLLGKKVNTLNVVETIKYEIPNDTYALGKATMDNAQFLFENTYGELSDESNSASIFFGFIRHKSRIRVVDGFMDKYTNPSSPTLVSQETFRGLIDDRQCTTTFDDQEQIVATGELETLCKGLTKSKLAATLTGTNSIENWVYIILNRAPFTDLFTVDSSNISAGLNITDFDMGEYDNGATILELLQDLAMGHSVFYVRDGVFHFTAYTASPTVDIDFSTSPERKISFKNYNSGAKRVKDNLYWEGTNISFENPTPIYDESEPIDIAGINTSLSRQDWVDYVGPRISSRRALFKLLIPFLPLLYLLDRVVVEREGAIQPDSFILDVTLLDVGRLIDPVGAIIITSATQWIVRGVKHDKKTQTELTLEVVESV